MTGTLMRAAELLRQYGRMADVVKDGEGAETLQVAADIERMAQAEPVAGQCKFSCEQKWQPCSVEHHYHVLANPAEWPGYETRLLYTHPRLPRDVLMAIARDAQRAAIQSCDEAGGDMGALHGIDLDAIVDRHAEKSAQAEPVNQPKLASYIAQVDACMDVTQVEPEDNAAWLAVKAAAESAQAQEGGAE